MIGRLSLTPAEVAGILNHELVVLLGTEPGTHRTHKLFYSPADAQCFVAVQDVANGAVVTILPLDYHANVAWTVSLDAQAEARRVLVGEEAEEAQEPRHAGAPEHIPKPPAFRFTGYLRTREGRIRVVTLGSWPSEPYTSRVDLLIEDDHVFDELRRRLDEKIHEGEVVERVYVHVGREGPVVPLEIDQPHATGE